jgi:hypothetical protein
VTASGGTAARGGGGCPHHHTTTTTTTTTTNTNTTNALKHLAIVELPDDIQQLERREGRRPKWRAKFE